MLGTLKTRLTALIADRAGLSSMEYAALAVGVVGAVLAGATIFGTALEGYLSTLFSTTGL